MNIQELQQVLDKYEVDINIGLVVEKWQEPHRHYHSINHLYDLVKQIQELYEQQEINEKGKEKLLLAALFHDIIYEPLRQDNEEQSAEYFLNLCRDKEDKDIQDIYHAILDTKTHESQRPLSVIFNSLDMNIAKRGFEELLDWEKGIHAEYSAYGDKLYKAGRLNFLLSLKDEYPENRQNIEKLISWVKTNY